ncbi:N-acetylneuraminate epimerase domain protein [Escherichia coli 8-415-05_S1_C2]|nr:N-acetylneuraminate epimerase domain protein [Escherichia coli 8-415-05_S1_C1]KEO04707.1 N-acetylneuraminate epimerase domain protein [Escherichia coli 8-415-05_S1_C2]KEO17377.1 N-acetylneuraminate epimerase domain protein [Escherichia coli 8-415-05_S1_C2]
MNKTITALAIMMASFAANASVLPETPVPFKSGTGAIDNDTVYIGLGSAGTVDWPHESPDNQYHLNK